MKKIGLLNRMKKLFTPFLATGKNIVTTQHPYRKHLVNKA